MSVRTGPPAATRATGLVAAVLVGAQFMISMDATIVNVALPVIHHRLGFSDAGLGWVVNAYALPFGGLLLLGARLGDTFGARRMFRIGVVVFTLASLWCGLAGGAGQLVAARAVQGVGAAIMSPVAMTLLIAGFDGSHRHRVLGWWGAMSGLAGGIGMLAGGLLTTVSWRWNFLVNVPAGLLVLWASRYVADRSAIRSGRADVAGAVVSTVALLLLAYAVVGTEHHGWASWHSSGLLALALALLVVFVRWEARHPDPLVPLRIFDNRSVPVGNMVIALTGAVGQIMYFTLTLYLQQVLGYSPVQSGAVFVPISIALFVVSTATARLVRRFGLRTGLVAGLVLSGGALAWLAAAPPGPDHLVSVLAPTLVWAIGWGAAQAMSFVAGARDVDGDLAGVASGLVATTYRLGGAIGLATMVTVAAGHTATLSAALPSPAAVAGGLVWAWWGGCALAGLAAALAAALPSAARPHRPPLPSHAPRSECTSRTSQTPGDPSWTSR